MLLLLLLLELLLKVLLLLLLLLVGLKDEGQVFRGQGERLTHRHLEMAREK